MLCPNIFEDFELDQSRSAWNRLLAQYGAAHAVHLAFNFLVVYSNNIFHTVPFPLPGGYATLLGICAAVSAAQVRVSYSGVIDYKRPNGELQEEYGLEVCHGK